MTQAFLAPGDILRLDGSDGSFEMRPEIATLPDGGWIAVWHAGATGGAFTEIRMRRFDADGQPAGPEVMVSSPVAEVRNTPKVATLEDGGWIVVWQEVESSQGEPLYAVMAQRHAADGTPLGPIAMLTDPLPGTDQSEPVVAALPDGGWIVAWHLSGGPVDGIRALRFNDAGQQVGPEIVVNSLPSGFAIRADIAVSEDGSFAIFWAAQGVDPAVLQGPDTDGWGIYGRIFNDRAIPQGPEFRVNEITTFDQTAVQATWLADGSIAVAFGSFRLGGAGDWVAVRVLDSNGAPLTGDILASGPPSEFAGAGATRPSILALPDGGFMVVWYERQGAPGDTEIVAQRFDAAGVALGDPMAVSDPGPDAETFPVLALLDDGQVLVAWFRTAFPPSADAADSTIVARILQPALFGTETADTLIGGNGADLIHGRGGPDLLSGEDGRDTIFGGAGRDTIIGGAGDDILWGDGGQDLIFGGARSDLIDGGAGNDTLFGGGGSDTIHGGDGRDSLRGDGGDDLLFGGADNDTLSGGNGNDTLHGDAGNDRLTGGQGQDLLFGGDGDDSLTGGADNDTLDGGPGNDTLSGGRGADLLQGGSGDDLIDGGDQADLGYGGEGFDTLYGGAGADTLFGGGDDDVIDGGDGDDVIHGDKGNDLLHGGDGHDLIHGGSGNDTVHGGAQSDTIFGGDGHDILQGDGGADLLQGDGGQDTLFGGGGDDTLLGGAGADLLYGGANNDRLEGGDASDTLHGEGGNDTLYGGAGSDILYGGGGDDLIYAGSGQDLLFGGAGADTLVGTSGTDVFVFEQGHDSAVIGSFDSLDVLRLDQQIWGGGLTPIEVVETFGSLGRQGVVLQFDAQHSLLLADFTDVSLLHLQIELI